MMAASSTIRKIRRELLLTASQFAEEAGLTKQSVSNYELGRSKPNYAAIRKIKKLADDNNIMVKVDDFFDDVPEDQDEDID
jgi:transcriptional regulator with XRE-family HTH domain